MEYPEEIIQKVWGKTQTAKEFNPDIMRKDRLGALIIRDHYGNHASEYGWEIDYIDPDKRTGKDDIENLEPLQWENKSLRKDGVFTGAVIAKHLSNIRFR